MISEPFHQVRVDDIDIAYAESGAGEPLVLLHGGENSREQFDGFRLVLGSGIRAIAFDQRDTGGTRNGSDSYDMVRLAQDCAGFIAALGIERAHVLGVSYGGMIAMQLAIHHPRRVASLILSGTTPSRTMIENLSERILALGPEVRAQHMLDLVLSPEAQARAPELVSEARRTLARRSEDGAARRLKALHDHDCRSRLGEITAPTLVLHGADDLIIDQRVAEYTASEIPGAGLVVLPHIRHGITLEAGEQAARLTREFVLNHPTGAPTGESGPAARTDAFLLEA
ncbi:alpha/beta fold hydrolase [Actinomadura montaniterrae]|uniref:Alpha/beta hydrolase n=1 Tax=Actinomadura montaniterrae TaxID=1803903 RepID=A0A6L3VZP9_9ACTN|nr:alpha/beta hydrolase [Actinomadura montaniterrae]KAB2385972.1 alpha/beta hydrolase [Actinomadura montaniterrae]